MNITKKYHIAAIILLVVSILLNVAPLATYVMLGLTSGAVIVEKVALTSTIFVVLIMSCVAWMNKTVMRSRIWLIMLGLFFCLDSIATPLIIIAITQVVDELIVCPLRARYKNRYTINKEIDKRNM
jgi:hypothetical protein